jgi:uncharacterized membrane protein YfcA
VASRFTAPLIGLAAGVVSGLFGVGGGIIVVPGLVLALGFPQRRASGTSMATIVASAAAALLVFVSDQQVDWPAAGLLGAGAVAGAWAGARYLDRIPERWLAIAFIVLLLLSAARLGLA